MTTRPSRPSLTATDLSRGVFLDVIASGHVFLRERGQPCTEGALPVFTTNTMEEAEQLRVLHCRLARDGSGLYQLNEPPVDVHDLNRIAELFRKSYRPKA